MNPNVAIDVFLDAFLHRLLPAFREVKLHALTGFTEEGYHAYIVSAGLGALLASVALFAFGIWLRRFPRKISDQKQQQRIEKLRAVAESWLPWLLILSPTPIGGMLIMAAGFFMVPARIAALVIVLAEIFWRLSPFV